MLRSQIQASQAIRQTQTIEHICITADPNTDSPLLMRDFLLMRNAFNKAKDFDNLASAVPLNNELEKNNLFRHQSSVIGHRSLVTNLVIYYQSLEKQVTDFNLKN